jgi:hypothetical protein
MLITYRDGSTKEHKHQRPPRFIMWRHGRSSQTFQSRFESIAEGGKELPDEEKGLLFMESLSDEEGRRYQAFTDDVVKHSLSPQPNVDELSEESYWEVFALTFYGVQSVPVETKEGVTTVEAVETFPDKPELPEAGEDVPDVRPERGGEDGVSRPELHRRRGRAGVGTAQA